MIWETDPQKTLGDWFLVSLANFHDLREQSHVFEHMGAAVG